MKMICANSSIGRLFKAVIIAGVWASIVCPAMALRPDQDARALAPATPVKSKIKKAPAPEHVQAAKRLGVNVTWHEQAGMPISVKGRNLGADRGKTLNLKAYPKAKIAEKADAALDRLEKVYGIRKTKDTFATRQIIHDHLNYCHVRRPQLYEGLRVIGGELIVHFDQDGQVYEVNGRYIPNIQLTLTVQYEAEEAAGIALADFEKNIAGEGQVTGDPEPVVFAYECEPKLAYETVVAGREPSIRWRYWIDAETGEILLKINDIKTIAAPTSSGAQATLSGNILSGEGGSAVSVTGWLENTGYYYLYSTNMRWYVYNNASSGYTDNQTYAYRATSAWSTSDRAEVSAARNFDLIQQYFRNVYGRSSFNNSSAMARANVHEGSDYVNAYWDGSDFHFGDGDGSEADCLAVLDVCAHEFTHGVTEYTADLYYYGESGALNESFSDIFGTCVEFYAQPDGSAVYPSRTAGQADWLIGEDCWLSSTALRDMRSPRNSATVGSSGVQPSRYYGTYWYSGSGDNGGVHYNSGVHNFLFYLISEGGSGNNDGLSYNITGLGISNAAQVAYRTLTVYCDYYTDHSGARSAWFSAANDLNPAWVTTISQAWDAVGVITIPELTSSSLGEAVNASELTWKTWGSTGSYWFAQSTTTYDGSQAAKSGPLGNSQQSYIYTAITGPGTLSFWWRVSSEEDWDYLYFYIDNSIQTYMSGESGWQNLTYSIASGSHTCRWSYIKDTSVARGSDAGWLDRVVWTPANNQAPATPTLTSPADGSISVELQPTLSASSFSDPDGNTHANTQWQIDTAGTFTSPTWDSGESYPAGTQTTVPADKLTNNTRYYWRVRYKDSQNTWSSWAAAFSFTTVQSALNPPATPGGVKASDGTYSNKIMVSWNVVQAATSYKVWRGTDNYSQNASCVETVDESLYSDTSFVYGQVYYYWVQAVNADGESALSTPDSGYCGTISTNLTTPGNVQASNGSYTNRIQITWQAVTGATSYNIYRSQNNDLTTATLIVNVSSSECRLSVGNGKSSACYYDDYAVSSLLSYYYWVQAKSETEVSLVSYVGMGYTKLDEAAIEGTADIGVSDLVFLPVKISNASHPGTVSCQVQNYGPDKLTASRIRFDFYLGSNVWVGESTVTTTLSVNAEALFVLTPTNRQNLSVRGDLAGTCVPEVHVRHLEQFYDPNPANNTARNAGEVTVTSAGVNSIGRGINDYDGDGKADGAICARDMSLWGVLYSGTRYRDSVMVEPGETEWMAVPGDYEGSGKTAAGVYVPLVGYWYVWFPTRGAGVTFYLGGPDYEPACADYDGDGKTDPVAYCARTGHWTGYVSAINYQTMEARLGSTGYKPYARDYDGDGKADPAVYNETDGTWKIMMSASQYGLRTGQFGGPGYQAVPADFDGDGKADFAVYKKTIGQWCILLSKNSYQMTSVSFGGSNYVPAVSDYDGDGKADLSVYEESTGIWYGLFSSRNYETACFQFGGPAYLPLGE